MTAPLAERAPQAVQNETVLSVEGLDLAARTRFGATKSIVEGVSLSIAKGAVHAVVGESGSGKTMLARAIVDLLPVGIEKTAGDVILGGRRLSDLSDKEMRKVRGAEIGFVFQEPMLSLNPAIPVGAQMAEGLSIHTDLSPAEVRKRCLEMLERVSIRDPDAAFTAYPHEYSGGMRQRIMLASVLALRPRLLIADEPTTALDAIIQRDVLDLMVELTRETGTSLLLITHDLGLVGEYADEATVMRLGKVVERGTIKDIFAAPKSDYTRALLSASPQRLDRPAVDRTAPPLLAIDDLRIDFYGKRRWPFAARPVNHAVRGVSLKIHEGENLAVVGESGSGKTTIGRAVLGLVDPSGGEMRLGDKAIDYRSRRRREELRRSLQIVFQDPASSLDPRFRVMDLVAEGLHRQGDTARNSVRTATLAALNDVGLGEEFADRFPHELSGGQKQRVAIARAIVMKPRLVIADEPVSALDLTVQSQVLKLMSDVQEAYGFSYFFVSHDLGVVEQVADRVIVMRAGRIVESADRDALFDRPLHPYTRRLLDASVEVIKDPEGRFKLRWRNERATVDGAPPLDVYEDGPHYRLFEAEPGHFVAVNGESRALAA